jgi:hypothetical protein
MKSIILKIRTLATQYPTLVTIGLGLAITLAIGATIGMLDLQHAYAGGIIVIDPRGHGCAC